MGDRLKEMLAEYGATAFVVYLVIFVATLLGFATAIRSGFAVESTGESAGLWFAAWLATKATQPLRIGATLLATPVVAGVVRRIRPPKLEAPSPEVAGPVTASAESATPEAVTSADSAAEDPRGPDSL